MVISGFVYWRYSQWGSHTFTFDVNCGRSPTLAEASLSTVAGEAYKSVGITRLMTRSTPVSEEQTVDFGPYYWQWAPKVYDQTMTQVTFAIGTGPRSQLSAHFQATFYEF